MTDNNETVAYDAYTGVAVAIFGVVSYTFLFPCNKLIPLDRRTVACVGALLCYLSRRFLFPSRNMNVLHAIDFDVLVLLASIMIVNHIVVHLRETKKIIVYLQTLVQENPEGGFWMIALSSFLLSPFLTNDGVCLLFVEPILNAFENTIRIDEENEANGSLIERNKSKLQTADAVYFLLALACSSNIGSALTYTGNPQNMIVATDSINVMPSYKFLIYMLLPSVLAWFVTIKWIQRCWRLNKEQLERDAIQNQLLCGGDPETNTSQLTEVHHTPFPRFNIPWCCCEEPGVTSPFSRKSDGVLSPTSPTRRRARGSGGGKQILKRVVRVVASPFPYMVLGLLAAMIVMIFVDVMPISGLICVSALVMVVCVVLGNHWRNQRVWEELSTHDDSALVTKLQPTDLQTAAMRRRSRSRSGAYAPMAQHMHTDSTNGFADDEERRVTSRHKTVPSGSSETTMVRLTHHPSLSREMISGSSKSSKFSKDSTAVSTQQPKGQYSVLNASGVNSNGSSLVINTSNENVVRRGDMTETDQQQQLTREEKIDNLNEFFEGLFGSIDYSLLLIFMGTFIVVENMASTGIPKYIWDKIVGRVPFNSFSSVVGISIFVLTSSQLLGNVAVIQLAKPNIESLDDNAKRYAWAVLSYVATVGGNLTITGSAANIIVVEKAARLDANMSIDFFRHFKVCFWITLFCCAFGGAIVSLIVQLDNANGSNW